MNRTEKLMKLASGHPELRAKIVPLLKQAMEHASPEAMEKYIQEHPGADKSNHHVKEQKDKAEGDSKPEQGNASGKMDQERSKSVDHLTKKLGIPKEDAEILMAKAERAGAKGGSGHPNVQAFGYLFPKAKGFDFANLDYAKEMPEDELKSEYGITRKDLDKYNSLKQQLGKAFDRGEKQDKAEEKAKKDKKKEDVIRTKGQAYYNKYKKQLKLAEKHPELRALIVPLLKKAAS